jgi:hypothetical protein
MAVQIPDHLQDWVANFPETHVGVHTVTVTLRDGRVFAPVEVSWATELFRVQGESRIPFSTDEIESIDDASGLS